MTYRPGDRAKCEQCGREIEYVGPHWRHAIGGKGKEFRHVAVPARDKPRDLFSDKGASS